jgi:hypothetical protein
MRIFSAGVYIFSENAIYSPPPFQLYIFSAFIIFPLLIVILLCYKIFKLCFMFLAIVLLHQSSVSSEPKRSATIYFIVFDNC